MVKTVMTGATSSPSSTATDPSPNSTPGPSTSAELISQNQPLPITVHKLHGKNYLEWAQSVKLIMEGRGKLGYLNGDIAQPAKNDPSLAKWKSENSFIIAWLINSMEPAIGKPYLFLPTAKDVWEAVKECYSDLEDSSQIFDLRLDFGSPSKVIRMSLRITL